MFMFRAHQTQRALIVALSTTTTSLASSMGQSKSKYAYQPADWPYVWALRDASVLDWKQGLDAEQIREIQLAQTDLPVEITPTLYLGNCLCALDMDKLQQFGIKRVLNMAGSLKSSQRASIEKAYQERGIKYKAMDAEDEEDYPLLDKHWEEAQQFINEDAEKVLVHCIAGHNRSSLTVAAHYLVTMPGANVIDTVRHIRKKRGNFALTNNGFQEQLVAFARIHRRLGEAPVPRCPPQTIAKGPKKPSPLDKLAY